MLHFAQGTPTEGVLYPATVTLIVEHSEEYWACQVQIVGTSLGGYTQRVTKEDLLKAKALELGAPLVLEKRNGRVRLHRAPPGSEQVLLPGALRLTNTEPYPLKVLALFPRLKQCQS
jgi:hypothetical protein